MRMDESGTFDRLVRELSNEERREMLDRILSSVHVSQDSLSAPVEDEEQFDYTKMYQDVSFFQKIIIFLKALFSRRDKFEVMEDIYLERISKQVMKSYPGLVSFKEGEFLPAFFEELRSLKEAASVFSRVIQETSEQQRMDFIAFLGGIELPDIQERFLKETDPELVAQEKSTDSDYDIRRSIEFALEDIIASISDYDRRIMYADASFIHVLRAFVAFPFDRLLSSFESGPSGRGSSTFVDIQKPLLELANILASLAVPPSDHVLEALFLFESRFLLDDETFDMEEHVKKSMERADTALAQIRHFNREVPLLDILKIVTRNINYRPIPIAGGEDWFSLYKQFYRKRFEKLFEVFLETRRKKKLIADVCAYLKIQTIPLLPFYRSGNWGGEVGVKHEVSLAFVHQFMKRVFFPELIPTLKMILIDGAFYKEQNREEFNDAYSGLMALPDRITALERSLSAEGPIGKAVEQVINESIPPRQKEKKLLAALKPADSNAQAIVQDAIARLELLVDVINGILFGEVGGKYDTLSNLGQIGGRESASFVPRLNEALKRLDDGRKKLKELFDAELAG